MMKRLALLVVMGGCAAPEPSVFDRCAELHRVCEGALDVVCHQDDRWCESTSPANAAMRSPLLVYCADAYEACVGG
jgi:hypothetical protein